MSLFAFKINMQQFREKVKVYADNCDVVELVTTTEGNFQTLQPDRYLDLLNEYNVFYTLKIPSPRDAGFYPAQSFNGGNI